MKTGWIIYNGNLNSDKIYELVVWLKNTGSEYNLELIPVKNNEIIFYYDQQSKPFLEHISIDGLPDFVISWDKDIPLAKHFELMDIRVYNNSTGIEICDNKVLTNQYFANHNIRIPKTIIAPMVYSNSTISDYSIYDHISDALGYPLVIKEAFGSFGEQVFLVSTLEELIKRVVLIGNKPHLFQEYIKNSHGRDIRLNVVNNKVITSMMRVSDTDFRANITSGAKAVAYSPTQEEIDLAVKSTKLLCLDFAGVDILFGEDGPILCEVNSNPHFKSIYECTGVDISRHIIEYIVSDLEV